MGQQDMRDALEQHGMLLFHPEQLGQRVTRRDGNAKALQRAGFTAQPVQQPLVLGSRFGVAPEFRRAQHLAIHIQRDQPMLLAGNADAEHGRTFHSGLCQRRRRSLFERLDPLLGRLFAAAVGAADQLMADRAFAQHGAGRDVEQQRLGALGAAVDAEKHRSS